MKPFARPAVVLAFLATLGFLLLAPAAEAQVLGLQATPAPGGSTTYSVPVQTLLLFSTLSFLPAILLLMTSFTRIVIVLALMRQALGLQSSPPNQVIVGLALFLTLFVMAPTLQQVHDQAYQPYTESRISFEEALAVASVPMRGFMLRQTRESDLEMFATIAMESAAESALAASAPGPADGAGALVRVSAGSPDPVPPDIESVPMRILIPAFVISELKTAFQIGFLVFIPFLMIDLIVSSVLMSMGMMMLSPVLVSLPFKLMLFVLADGWSLLVASMLSSF